jgi:hypothetical protein
MAVILAGGEVIARKEGQAQVPRQLQRGGHCADRLGHQQLIDQLGQRPRAIGADMSDLAQWRKDRGQTARLDRHGLRLVMADRGHDNQGCPRLHHPCRTLGTEQDVSADRARAEHDKRHISLAHGLGGRGHLMRPGWHLAWAAVPQRHREPRADQTGGHRPPPSIRFPKSRSRDHTL